MILFAPFFKFVSDWVSLLVSEWVTWNCYISLDIQLVRSALLYKLSFTCSLTLSLSDPTQNEQQREILANCRMKQTSFLNDPFCTFFCAANDFYSFYCVIMFSQCILHSNFVDVSSTHKIILVLANRDGGFKTFSVDKG